MSEESKKVLEMVKEGKITVEEAERLLNAIGGADRPGSAITGAGGKGSPTYLRVTVESRKGDNVNVRVPLKLVRAGMKFSSFIPEAAKIHINQHLTDKGINLDLGKLKPEDLDEFIRALSDLEVNVDSEGGDKVRVFCE